MTARWADMVLEDEAVGFEPVGDTVGVIQTEGVQSWTVVRRFLTEKLIKIEYMRQVMALVWQPVRGVQVSELQPNLFLFVFFHESDMHHVLQEGPWSFENHTLICRQVQDGVLPGDVVLDAVDMWVQVHDLPLGYTSDEVLEQVGNFLGSFVRCDDRFAGTPWRSFYRVRVAIPVARPIKRRMRLVKRDKQCCWVTFKYERLHTFCFFCGFLGHSHKFCLRARESGLPLDQYPYGADLRAGGGRGTRAVGDPWLVPLGGSPRAADSPAVSASENCGGRGAPQQSSKQIEERGIVAVSKRCLEGSGPGSRRSGSGNGDVTMTEVSKNLHMAGTGSQSRPSS
ncbi:uncharacterized protein LOC116011141 [Ipomoea triloba]|uniref:uncharacterized protein LOC116011141 n=1 Tax=Ipomoea triloba TaxID=35885 RepID=UPI00125D2C32|nr:uncharacterized protein LOC116011141 [Ipomoea triloba]